MHTGPAHQLAEIPRDEGNSHARPSTCNSVVIAMRYQVVHTTDYFVQRVGAVCARTKCTSSRATRARQTCLAHRLTILPTPQRVEECRDYFGNDDSFFHDRRPARRAVGDRRQRSRARVGRLHSSRGRRRRGKLVRDATQGLAGRPKRLTHSSSCSIRRMWRRRDAGRFCAESFAPAGPGSRPCSI